MWGGWYKNPCLNEAFLTYGLLLTTLLAPFCVASCAVGKPPDHCRKTGAMGCHCSRWGAAAAFAVPHKSTRWCSRVVTRGDKTTETDGRGKTDAWGKTDAYPHDEDKSKFTYASITRAAQSGTKAFPCSPTLTGRNKKITPCIRETCGDREPFRTCVPWP
jgi:hypothetical protein